MKTVKHGITIAIDGTTTSGMNAKLALGAVTGRNVGVEKLHGNVPMNERGDGIGDGDMNTRTTDGWHIELLPAAFSLYR